MKGIANIYTTKAERTKSWATINTEPSLTQQADAKECDINFIMAKYQKTGQLPQLLNKPLFGDFSNPPEYREAVEAVNAAHEAFMSIPAKIRAEFANDADAFMKFTSDPANKPKLKEWGLINPDPRPTIEQENSTTLREIRDALKPKPEGNTNGNAK